MLCARHVRLACSLLLVLATGCDSDPTAPVTDPVSRVEDLLTSAYRAWYTGQHSARGPSLVLSAQAFQHSCTRTEHGMELYSRIPRQAIQNNVSHAHYESIEWAWNQNYQALGYAIRAIRAVEDEPETAAALGPGGVARVRAFATLVQAMALGDLALIYDRAYVVDATTPLNGSGLPVLSGSPAVYGMVMNAARLRYDQAIALATGAPAGVEVPRGWMAATDDLSMTDLVRLAHSMTAIQMAAVARNPAERAAVNWGAVLSHASQGIRSDFRQDMAVVRSWIPEHLAYQHAHDAEWQQLNYFVHGMADQSGQYQSWLSQPVAQRTATAPGGTQPVLIVTADRRFPQGADIGQQVNQWGRHVGIRRLGVPPTATVANAMQFSRPENGTWRWSQYYLRPLEHSNGGRVLSEVQISRAELRLLAAEGHFRMGNLAAAADSMNISRVFHGLTATDPAGTNTSCVPRLPNGTCGNLFEILKWEKRMETWQRGPYASGWYFDGRGWGDLYRGTPLQFPIPARQMQALGLGAAYTFGGPGGTMSAPVSTYQFPGE